MAPISLFWITQSIHLPTFSWSFVFAGIKSQHTEPPWTTSWNLGRQVSALTCHYYALTPVLHLSLGGLRDLALHTNGLPTCRRGAATQRDGVLGYNYPICQAWQGFGTSYWADQARWASLQGVFGAYSPLLPGFFVGGDQMPLVGVSFHFQQLASSRMCF